MKFIFIVLTLISTQLSYAGNSEMMVRTLEDAGVTMWGRKQNLQADVDCKINRYQAFRCVISHNGHTYKIYTGDEATAVSELLKTFDVRPVGRKKIQEAAILCRIEKDDTVHTCEDLSYDYPTN